MVIEGSLCDDPDDPTSGVWTGPNDLLLTNGKWQKWQMSLLRLGYKRTVSSLSLSHLLSCSGKSRGVLPCGETHVARVWCLASSQQGSEAVTSMWVSWEKNQHRLTGDCSCEPLTRLLERCWAPDDRYQTPGHRKQKIINVVLSHYAFGQGGGADEGDNLLHDCS